ncbi:MAG: DUF393 domain-containing protein [Bacteroidetes bacterium]|nr:MAG: DUF393 domain-containing protein [Bacteroidota bacterium]
MNNCGKNIILIDSECVLCTRSAGYIYKRDKGQKFQFSELSSDFFRELRKNHPELDKTDSVILWQNGQIYTRTDAVIRILRELGVREKLAAEILNLFPKLWRDSLYNWTARNRRRIFKNKHKQCHWQIKRHYVE